VNVLADERLGLYGDREATQPLGGLSFGLLKLKARTEQGRMTS